MLSTTDRTERSDPAIRRMLEGYSLATAHILYRMPDRLSLLQSFTWQDFDEAPDFPVLNRFLDFWARSLDGPIHSVEVAHARLLRPAELKPVGGIWTLN
jgi:uncharacterized protein Usg